MNFANILHFTPISASFMKYTIKIVFQKVFIQRNGNYISGT